MRCQSAIEIGEREIGGVEKVERVVVHAYNCGVCRRLWSMKQKAAMVCCIGAHQKSASVRPRPRPLSASFSISSDGCCAGDIHLGAPFSSRREPQIDQIPRPHALMPSRRSPV